MDIYGLFDLLAISLAGLVVVKMRNHESVYLLAFFALSSIMSIVMFETEYYIYWAGVFTGLCVVFGSASYRHPVVMGYAAYLVLVGIDALIDVHWYSEIVFTIFAYQLWVIRYGSDHGHYISWLWPGSPTQARTKSTQKGKG